MSSSEYGPGYQDCYTYCEHIWARYGHRIDIRLVQPVRRLDGKGNSGWTIVTSLEPREGNSGVPFRTSSAFGQGGSWKTLPAALHAALRDAEETLKARELLAREQARF